MSRILFQFFRLRDLTLPNRLVRFPLARRRFARLFLWHPGGSARIMPLLTTRLLQSIRQDFVEGTGVVSFVLARRWFRWT